MSVQPQMIASLGIVHRRRIATKDMDLKRRDYFLMSSNLGKQKRRFFTVCEHDKVRTIFTPKHKKIHKIHRTHTTKKRIFYLHLKTPRTAVEFICLVRAIRKYVASLGNIQTFSISALELLANTLTVSCELKMDPLRRSQ